MKKFDSIIDLENINYLCGGLDKKDNRDYCKCISVEKHPDDKIICVSTNGRSLHTITFDTKTTPLEAGYYSVVSNTKKLIVLDDFKMDSYPKWKRIYDDADKNNIKIGSYHLYHTEMKHNFYDLIGVLYKLGYQLNPKFIDPLVPLNLKWDIFVNPVHKKQAVKFESGKYSALIMPYYDESKENFEASAIEVLNEALKEKEINDEK